MCMLHLFALLGGLEALDGGQGAGGSGDALVDEG